jgi:hypothetical protein
MRKKGAIIVYLSGGLGNQMFQYAFGRYLSLKHGVPLKLDPAMLMDRKSKMGTYEYVFREYALDIFNIKATVAKQSEVPLLYRHWVNGIPMLVIEAVRRKVFKRKAFETTFHFDESKLSLGPNVYLEGYWQSEKYFESIKDIIREDFTLKEPLPQETTDLMAEINSVSSLCIHVRRGDYTTAQSVYYYGALDKSYYDKGIETIEQYGPIDRIYIFSDDPEWCKANLQFNLPTIVVDDKYSGDKARGHLMLMTACKYFIIPNSTFSWWGAWLSTREGKKIVAPKKWRGDETVNTNDATPPEWIRI